MTMTEVHARDLTPAVREWMQTLFARPLRDDEQVSLIVHAPEPKTAAERAAAWERLNARLAVFRQGGDRAPESEIDAAVDEAMRSVRPGYESVR